MKKSTDIFVIISVIILSVAIVAVFSGKVEKRTNDMLGVSREEYLNVDILKGILF